MHGGHRLYALRDRIGKSQSEVEVDALLGEGYLHRLESGKVTNPKRDTLERILATLKATYNERYEILDMFGYQVSTPLPTDAEIAWAVAVCEPHLQSCPYPAYLLDCAYRLWAWNEYIPRLIGHDPDSLRMRRFQGCCILEVILDESYGLVGFADNPDEIFSSVLLTFRAGLYAHRNEVWFHEMKDNLMKIPRFKQYWDLTEHYQQPANRPTHPPAFFRINVPGGEQKQFRVLSFPFSQDRRFLVVEYIPFSSEGP